MDNSIFLLFNSADEIKGSEYGQEFVMEIQKAYKSRKISYADVEKIVETLTEIDEIRIVFAIQIKQLVYMNLESSSSLDNVCLLFKAMANFYNGEFLKKFYVESLFSEILQDETTLPDAIDRIMEVIEKC